MLLERVDEHSSRHIVAREMVKPDVGAIGMSLGAVVKMMLQGVCCKGLSYGFMSRVGMLMLRKLLPWRGR